jgi:hypothetical protein
VCSSPISKIVRSIQRKCRQKNSPVQRSSHESANAEEFLYGHKGIIGENISRSSSLEVESHPSRMEFCFYCSWNLIPFLCYMYSGLGNLAERGRVSKTRSLLCKQQQKLFCLVRRNRSPTLKRELTRGFFEFTKYMRRAMFKLSGSAAAVTRCLAGGSYIIQTMNMFVGGDWLSRLRKCYMEVGPQQRPFHESPLYNKLSVYPQKAKRFSSNRWWTAGTPLHRRQSKEGRREHTNGFCSLINNKK